tara:strand:- start:266 stop:400 length:135 start_codon:yes stop_codon:yes gene_type:complete
LQPFFIVFSGIENDIFDPKWWRHPSAPQIQWLTGGDQVAYLASN